MFDSFELKKFRNRLRKINIFFHPWRNNPRTVNMVYYGLIAMAGYDKWREFDAEITMAWKSASNSFDQMYGLVKAWSENGLPVIDEYNKKKLDFEKEKRDYELWKQTQEFIESQKEDVGETGAKDHAEQLLKLERQTELLKAELEKVKVEVELMENRRKLKNGAGGLTDTIIQPSEAI